MNMRKHQGTWKLIPYLSLFIDGSIAHKMTAEWAIFKTKVENGKYIFNL